LLEKCTANILFRWDNGRFKDKEKIKKKLDKIEEEERTSFFKDKTLRKEYCYNILEY